ncbi:hypothetical protein M7I_4980 [Glarea lozoyensis 74030]|uniref:Uncharacterized protein n=1 Tax=Glarea lozoyensis (strain ATCC 74030 / MF5533) TaxID=1104152 RepID=H0EQM6_GLAL7|nr:hypothetical protein M7I_4980 [Glarea lozoyensis 74030]
MADERAQEEMMESVKAAMMMDNCIACVEVYQETIKDKTGTEGEVAVEGLAVPDGVDIPVLLQGCQNTLAQSSTLPTRGGLKASKWAPVSSEPCLDAANCRPATTDKNTLRIFAATAQKGDDTKTWNVNVRLHQLSKSHPVVLEIEEKAAENKILFEGSIAVNSLLEIMENDPRVITFCNVSPIVRDLIWTVRVEDSNIARDARKEEVLRSDKHLRASEELVCEYFRQSETFSRLNEAEERKYLEVMGWKLLAKALLLRDNSAAEAAAEGEGDPCFAQASPLNPPIGTLNQSLSFPDDNDLATELEKSVKEHRVEESTANVLEEEGKPPIRITYSIDELLILRNRAATINKHRHIQDRIKLLETFKAHHKAYKVKATMANTKMQRARLAKLSHTCLGKLRLLRAEA